MRKNIRYVVAVCDGYWEYNDGTQKWERMSGMLLQCVMGIESTMMEHRSEKEYQVCCCSVWWVLRVQWWNTEVRKNVRYVVAVCDGYWEYNDGTQKWERISGMLLQCVMGIDCTMMEHRSEKEYQVCCCSVWWVLRVQWWNTEVRKNIRYVVAVCDGYWEYNDGTQKWERMSCSSVWWVLRVQWWNTEVRKNVRYVVAVCDGYWEYNDGTQKWERISGMLLQCVMGIESTMMEHRSEKEYQVCCCSVWWVFRVKWWNTEVKKNIRYVVAVCDDYLKFHNGTRKSERLSDMLL